MYVKKNARFSKYSLKFQIVKLIQLLVRKKKH